MIKRVDISRPEDLTVYCNEHGITKKNIVYCGPYIVTGYRCNEYPGKGMTLIYEERNEE